MTKTGTTKTSLQDIRAKNYTSPSRDRNRMSVGYGGGGIDKN